MSARLRAESGADPERVRRTVRDGLLRLLAEPGLGHVAVERANEPPEQSSGGKYRKVVSLARGRSLRTDGGFGMERRTLKIVYGLGWSAVALIRIPYRQRAAGRMVVDDRKTAEEKTLLGLLAVGMVMLPLVHVSTPWLRFADYRLRPWAGWLGGSVMAVGLWVLWRSHAELGALWSDSVQLRQGHRLVTGGVYRYVRHPMYAFGWLLGVAQALLLQNWVAGPAGLVSFALLYVRRVPREERMMLDRFGEEYRAYMERTGRVVPRWGRG